MLRPYQIEDINLFKELNTIGYFNEQRTGKTPIALIAADSKNIKKLIVVCPKSAIYQWAEEFNKWLQKPCIVVSGTKQQKLKAISKWEYGLVVSYGSFKTTSHNTGLIDEILKHNPDCIIIDEAHRIKNPKTAITTSIFQTKTIPYRIALTGTPAPNKPHEIWSILHWLRPNQFKSYWDFIKEYFHTTNQRTPNGKMFIDIRSFKLGKDKLLQKYLSEFTTNRKRKDIMKWLPPKQPNIQIKLPPTKEQEKYLSDLTKYFETEHIITHGVLDRLCRYRQICLHPQLLDLKGKSPKLDWIKDYLEDYPEQPIIIFSKFTSFLKILSKELNCNNLIIGETSTIKRNQLKNDFQNGKINLLLLNIDCGKEALTLDRAETIIFTDKYPPIADIQQAEDRFIATTEQMANTPKTIYELMIKGTYDEHLYELIDKRYSETEIINNYKYYLEGSKKKCE